jgi:hypothetical protein
VFPKVFKLSFEVSECKPLLIGGPNPDSPDEEAADIMDDALAAGRGSHSPASRLNLSAFCEIGLHSGVVEGMCRRCQGLS